MLPQSTTSFCRFPVLQACRDSLRISSRKGRSFIPILTRLFSSENNQTPFANETLTLLHKATTVLPRALDIKQASDSTRTADFWNSILSNIKEDLLATSESEGAAKIVGSCTPIVFCFLFERSIDCALTFQYVA